MLCYYIAAGLPLVGVVIGAAMFFTAFLWVSGPERKRFMVFGFMLVPIGLYGLITAAIIYGTQADAFNGALAGAIIEGSASCVTAIGLGYVAKKGMEACMAQMKLFVGVVLIMIFVATQALYGLILALVVISKAKMSGDATYDEATGMGLCCALGFSGSVLAAVVTGTKALEISTEMPETFMKNFRPTTSSNWIGILVLINGVMARGNFQSYALSGFGFLCGGVLIAFAAVCAASTSGQRVSRPVVAVGLSLAFVSLVFNVVMGNGTPNYGPRDTTTPSPDDQLELLSRTTAALPISVAAGALCAAVALGVAAGALRRSPGPTDSTLPLLQ